MKNFNIHTDLREGDIIRRISNHNEPCHFIGEEYEFIQYLTGSNMLFTVSKDCKHSACMKNKGCSGIISKFELVRNRFNKHFLEDSLFEVE